MKFTVTIGGKYVEEITLPVVAFGTRLKLQTLDDQLVMTYVEIRLRNDGALIIEFSAYGVSSKTYHGHCIVSQ